MKNIKSYRDSHIDAGYGDRYSETYAKGYYLHQWEKIEEPLLRYRLGELRAEGKLSALDFACGTGRILWVLEQYFDVTYGVDVSEAMLYHARKKCVKSKIICQDITTKPVDLKVDIVTVFRFFLNAEPALRKVALRAIHDNLNSSGMLIANIHVNSRSILGMVYRARNRFKGYRCANIMRYEEMVNLIQESGFDVKETTWYSYLPRTGWRGGKLAGLLMPKVEKMCKILRVPGHLAQCFLICAIKR